MTTEKIVVADQAITSGVGKKLRLPCGTNSVNQCRFEISRLSIAVFCNLDSAVSWQAARYLQLLSAEQVPRTRESLSHDL